MAVVPPISAADTQPTTGTNAATSAAMDAVAPDTSNAAQAGPQRGGVSGKEKNTKPVVSREERDMLKLAKSNAKRVADATERCIVNLKLADSVTEAHQVAMRAIFNHMHYQFLCASSETVKLIIECAAGKTMPELQAMMEDFKQQPGEAGVGAVGQGSGAAAAGQRPGSATAGQSSGLAVAGQSHEAAAAGQISGPAAVVEAKTPGKRGRKSKVERLQIARVKAQREAAEFARSACAAAGGDVEAQEEASRKADAIIAAVYEDAVDKQARLDLLPRKVGRRTKQQTENFKEAESLAVAAATKAANAVTTFKASMAGGVGTSAPPASNGGVDPFNAPAGDHAAPGIAALVPRAQVTPILSRPAPEEEHDGSKEDSEGRKRKRKRKGAKKVCFAAALVQCKGGDIAAQNGDINVPGDGACGERHEAPENEGGKGPEEEDPEAAEEDINDADGTKKRKRTPEEREARKREKEARKQEKKAKEEALLAALAGAGDAAAEVEAEGDGARGDGHEAPENERGKGPAAEDPEAAEEADNEGGGSRVNGVMETEEEEDQALATTNEALPSLTAVPADPSAAKNGDSDASGKKKQKTVRTPEEKAAKKMRRAAKKAHMAQAEEDAEVVAPDMAEVDAVVERAAQLGGDTNIAVADAHVGGGQRKTKEHVRKPLGKGATIA